MGDNEEKFDAILISIARQHEGGIEEVYVLLDTFFGFLRRKTDFFAGVGKEKAEKTKIKAEEDARRAEEEANYEIKTKKKSQRLRLQKKSEDAKPTKEQTPPTESKSKDQDSDSETDPEEKGKLRPNSGNGGGDYDHYKWTQTLGEVDVHVSLKASFPVRSRDVVCNIQQSHLTIGLKGFDPIASGLLNGKVKVEESFWTLEDKKLVVIHLEKALEISRTVVQRLYALLYR
ncbi:nuclear migration protein nudC-like [Oscarella lobularis]|uniref:nuclear migration protein nudC-like n=1 Tax=Oscarella lobularis TaxID=121494 RepID=UPI0033134077